MKNNIEKKKKYEVSLLKIIVAEHLKKGKIDFSERCEIVLRHRHANTNYTRYTFAVTGSTLPTTAMKMPTCSLPNHMLQLDICT